MVNYRTLIAVDLIFGVAGRRSALLAFVVPGILVFVYLGLAAPVVEIEHRGVRAALARSFRLVRGHFWLVLAVLVPIEIASDAADRPGDRPRPRPARRLAARRVADRHRLQHRADPLLRGRRGAAHARPDRREGRRARRVYTRPRRSR